jgi:neutral ceramidase
MNGPDLRAGVARATITPPVGLRLIGTLREGVPARVEQDLTVTALVLAGSGTTAVVLACDLAILTVADAGALRDRVAEAVGVSRAAVMVNVSHTHATPTLPDFGEFDAEAEPEQAALAAAYREQVFERAATAASAAAGRLRPVRAGAAAGAVRIGVNRREQLPDGTMVLGENPDGVIDPAVGVLRIDDASGAPLAVVVHHACHPDVLGPKCDLISPDYVGETRKVVETLTGATMLFLQGAAGDIDPRSGIVLGGDGVDAARRLGGELGCEAARVWHTIDTARERDRRVAWRSAASVVTGWAYRDAADRPQPLAVRSADLTLPLRELPPTGDALALLRAEREHSARVSDGSLPERLIARRRVRWAEVQAQAAERGGPCEVGVELQVLRIGDAVLVGIPGEPFVEIGLAIKAASPALLTLVCGYTNGNRFYIPTAAAFEQGGYEVESHRNFLQPAGPTREWGERLVAAAGELIEAVSETREAAHAA